MIGIVPGDDRGRANEFVSIALATGLGELRNGLIIRACDAAVAVARVLELADAPRQS